MKRKAVRSQSADPVPTKQISVIVPENPFAPDPIRGAKHCLCALDVERLMEWWPGRPHAPHRDPKKVRSIQRSLDWKRVAQIAAYLLQEEIVGAPEKLDQVFSEIYEPRRNEPGRQWPPKIPKVIGYQRSAFPTFSNVLIHVNGAQIRRIENSPAGTASLIFDENNPKLNFSVIDGQHRINGAFLAVRLLNIRGKNVKWEIPAEIFLDLDAENSAPQHQAQIFIDVNFYQKKVDRSLVADLFPTARGGRSAIDSKERAQDIGRRLMLETGPLVGLIQIPGIRYGTKDVVTLATLNSAIEDCLEALMTVDITGLEAQSEFIAMCLNAWLEASGRLENPADVLKRGLSSTNVVYQGRVIVSVLTLLPAVLVELKDERIRLDSNKAVSHLIDWFRKLARRAGLLNDKGEFLDKDEFKERRYLGAGGLGMLRDVMWAAASGSTKVSTMDEDEIVERADKHRRKTLYLLSK